MRARRGTHVEYIKFFFFMHQIQDLFMLIIFARCFMVGIVIILYIQYT